MSRIFCKFITYSSCERALKNRVGGGGGGLKSKIGNRLLMTWFFWLHLIIYDYFSSVFCFVSKKLLWLKYRKWVSPLKNPYHYAKVLENARIILNHSLLHPVVFWKTKPQIFWSSFVGCFLQWLGWLHYECVRISAFKYCQCHAGNLLVFRERP